MSKCKITGKVLSVQLGREETQIVLLGSKNEILNSVAFETPVGAVEDGAIRNFEAIRGMLRTALKTPGLKRTRQVVFSLCTSQVITDIVTVPDIAGAKLEKLLMANVDMYFPVDMQDYHVAWQIVGTKEQEDGQKEQLVQMWALPKEMLEPYYTVANACGLSVAAVDFCGHSIATAVGASYVKASKPAKAKKQKKVKRKKGAENEEQQAAAEEVAESRPATETDLHITLEWDLIGMTFVQDSQVVLQRFIRCGSDPSYQFDEIAMMVEYFRSMDIGRGSTIRGILSGALATDTDRVEALTDMLDIPLTNFEAEYDPRLILCVGAGHTDLDFGIATLNSPSKARRQVSDHLWQYALVLLGGLALVGVILLTLSSRLVWNAEITRLQNTQQALAVQAAQSKDYANNYNSYKSQYAAYSADWETVFASLQTYNDNLVLVLEELEGIMPKGSSITNLNDGQYVGLTYKTVPMTGLQIFADGINVQFACQTKEEAAYLIMALRNLQYADVAAISDLSGGGKGAVDSYGSGDSNVENPPAEGSDYVEAPPTEGNAATVDNSAVTKLIFSQLNEDAMVDLAKNMTDEQFAALEKAYGKQPASTAPSVSDLKNDNQDKLTLEMRQQAIREMMMNDPFAIDTFADLMAEDFVRKEPILWDDIMLDVIILEREGKLDFGTAENAVSVRNQMEALVGVLTKDETTVSAVEELLATNPKTEKTYIHYLEVELGLREKELLPFLDVEKVFTDILTGGFKTEDEELNKSLNGLISDDVWSMVNTINDPTKMGELFDKFMAEGTTGNELFDSLIDNYMKTGTTGYGKVDEILEKYVGADNMNDKMTQMLTKYLTEGTSGNAQFDKLIEGYLNNGTTGNAQMDKAINDFIKSGKLDNAMADVVNKYITKGTTGNKVLDGMMEKFLRTGTTGNTQMDGLISNFIKGGKLDSVMGDMLNKYITTGTSGHKVLDEMIEKFMRTGTTGNTVLDGMIKGYLESGKFTEQLEPMLSKYLIEGTTGNKLLDELVGKYMKNGSTGNAVLDKLINSYIDNMMKGLDDKKIADLVQKYMTTGTTGNKLYDALLKKYFKDGTTGIKKLDAMIEKYKNSITGGGTNNDILDLLDKLIGNNGSGNNNNNTQTPQVDTRIFFTVTLIYNEELKNAELVRKGLDYTAKVDELEVAE